MMSQWAFFCSKPGVGGTIIALQVPYVETICDMIKGDESDVGNIDFELQA